ncbi:hypothetical protein RhiTH_007259 [Rhizoctonia solani]
MFSAVVLYGLLGCSLLSNTVGRLLDAQGQKLFHILPLIGIFAKWLNLLWSLVASQLSARQCSLENLKHPSNPTPIQFSATPICLDFPSTPTYATV